MTIPILLFLLTSTLIAPSEEVRREQIMDSIEKQVALPKGALPLSEYGRNYTYLKGGKVIGVYLIPPKPSDPDEGCSAIGDDDELKPCSAEELKEIADMERQLIESQARANERRWFVSVHQDLPGINDGGCSQVTIIYDEASGKILTAECNGSV